MLKTNEIMQKIAFVHIEKTFFVHPEMHADGKHFFETKEMLSLVEFNLGQTKYLITPLELDQMAGYTSLYTIYINDGNMWHKAFLHLTSYEWYYFTGGEELVNEQKYYKDPLLDKYLTEAEYNNVVTSWEESLGDTDEDRNMKTYIHNKYVRVVMRNGTWENLSVSETKNN